MNYYISDLHFGHKNIIAFDNRPFKTVEEMDEVLISNWNQTVSEGDHVYILGDLCWGKAKDWPAVLERLSGNKHLIRGNHDIPLPMQPAVRRYFADVTDPFTGETLAAVQAIRPDFAIVHAQTADANGNACFEGPPYEDVLLSRAAKKVIVTAERIVGDGWFSAGEQKADIPHFMTAAVVHAPRGASPCACYGYYEPNDSLIRAFLALDGEAALHDFIRGRGEP